MPRYFPTMHGNRPPHKSPRGAVCSKCGEKILYNEQTKLGEGRRFRMKWRHRECLPATRQNKIQWRDKEETKTVGDKNGRRL